MNKTITNNALLLGGVASIIFLAVHFISPKMNFNIAVSLAIGTIVPFYFMYKGAKEQREEEEGLLTFGEAMAASFPIYVIGVLILTVVQIAIFYADPGFLEAMKESTLEQSEKMFAMLENVTDVNEEGKTEAMKQMSEQMDGLGIGTLLTGFVFSLLWPGAILALIVSLIVKKS